MIILVSTVTGCVCVRVGISSSAVGMKICTITVGIKKFKSVIRKKKKKHNRIVLLGKSKLDTIAVLLSKALIDSYIKHDEFGSVDSMLREYNETKEVMKSPETSVDYIIWKQWKYIMSVVKKIQQTKIQVLEKLMEK